jgi:hypothetical protein
MTTENFTQGKWALYVNCKQKQRTAGAVYSQHGKVGVCII